MEMAWLDGDFGLRWKEFVDEGKKELTNPLLKRTSPAISFPEQSWDFFQQDGIPILARGIFLKRQPAILGSNAN